jgi:ectoine hydroxylase-related dioxygenase (phytanoyl-CoA dioxygenase family)
MPTLQPGDACIFDRECLHCSSVNETDSPRFAYAAQFMAEHTRLASTGERVPGKILATELRELRLGRL